MNRNISDVISTTGKTIWNIAVAAALAMGGLGLTACADTSSPGTPMPVTTTTTGKSETKTSPTATSSATKVDSLADADPCELLTDADKSTLGVTETLGSEGSGTARICRLRLPDSNLTPGIRTNVGLDGVVVNGPITDVAIGSRQAKQMRTNTGGCFVFIGVTPSSRVDVQASELRGDQEAACDLALRAAKLIEPNLPE